jgi:hypothetical protein
LLPGLLFDHPPSLPFFFLFSSLLYSCYLSISLSLFLSFFLCFVSFNVVTQLILNYT